MKLTKEKPFDILLSREQQQFLKELREYLQAMYDEYIPEDDEGPLPEQIHLSIEAIFKLPIAELNLYLIKVLGNYKSTTELANLLNITKQTICTHMRKIKLYIEDYVKDNSKFNSH